MGGRWEVLPAPPAARDRRERARVTVEDGATAVLLSAPIFEVGEGDPFVSHPYVSRLGPDILPYSGEGPFAASCFVERLTTPANRERAVGAALLDQTVVAGIGNYLRAEILFVCRLSPWRVVGELSEEDIRCLCRAIPEIAARAYTSGGRTVTEAESERMARDRTLLYPNSVSKGWGSRHYAFRRTNLPCLACGSPIRQKRQRVYQTDEGEEKERITYYCPTCQSTE
jgi:formamidopyrimidine-DNA glycosylase